MWRLYSEASRECGAWSCFHRKIKFREETILHKLRVAFVGCGGVAAHYLDVYRALNWVQVVACIDTQPAIAAAAAEFLSRQAEFTPPLVTTDFAAALADDVDVVVINTPNHLHHEQAITALEAGKHVLLQKPVAPTVAEAEQIALAAARAKGTSGLYMSYFDQPLLHDLKEMIAVGWFGKVGHFYARLMHRGGLIRSRQALDGQRTWRESTVQTGGGCFIQLAVHYIHLMEWMNNDRVVRATAVAKNLHCPGIEGEDIASAILEFESGALATLDMGWSVYGEQFSVHGTEGSAEYLNNRLLLLESKEHSFHGRVVNYTAAAVDLSWGQSGAESSSEVIPPAMGDHTNPLNQHRTFLEAVRDGAQPFVSIASGVDDMRVVAEVYESARTGRAVMIDRRVV
jgi:predicted dehydrogenase